MHLDAVKFTVGAGAKVIFHIARTADIIGVRASARKFVEDDAVGLGHNIGQNVQDGRDAACRRRSRARQGCPPYLITASSAGIIASPPSRPKRLVPTYLRPRNFSYCSASMTFAEDRLLALGRELDRGVLCLPSALAKTGVLQRRQCAYIQDPLARSNWRAGYRPIRVRSSIRGRVCRRHRRAFRSRSAPEKP